MGIAFHCCFCYALNAWLSAAILTIQLLTGANVAPVSQAVFGTTAGPVMNPRMPSEANAGKLAHPVPRAPGA